MAIGCIITLSPPGRILARRPCWPWPSPGSYPLTLPDGRIEQFFPHSYFRFKLGDLIAPFPPTPSPQRSQYETHP